LRTCPYCDSRIPEEESLCPECGAPYWDPVTSDPMDPASRKIPAETGGGCLSLVALPMGVALVVTGALILAGWLFDRLLHWDSPPVKLLWLALSAAVGIRVFDRMRRPRPPDDPPF